MDPGPWCSTKSVTNRARYPPPTTRSIPIQYTGQAAVYNYVDEHRLPNYEEPEYEKLPDLTHFPRMRPSSDTLVSL